jgi:hypothetical protein
LRGSFKHHYGPYAENLNFVLQKLEGHYIRGYGDRSKEAEIYLLPEATEQAMKYLAEDKESLRRLEQVNQIIRGFETPYGLELLSTVHWVMSENKSISSNPEQIVMEVRNWSERKKQIFKENHIAKAWEHLTKLANSNTIHI